MPHRVKPGVSEDTGLDVLVLVARYHGLAADADELRHRFGRSGESFTAEQILRAARHLGLKARLAVGSWRSLAGTPVPALIQHVDGHWMVLARIDADKVLLHDPLEARP